MNKQQLIQKLAGDTGLSEQKVRLVIDCFCQTTIETLAEGHSVALLNFGAYRPIWQNERPGRNPKTGEPKMIRSRFTVKFRLGKGFLEALNENK